MINKENFKTAEKGSIVTIGRLKGNIKPGDAVYKITDNKLSEQIENSLKVEFVTKSSIGFVLSLP